MTGREYMETIQKVRRRIRLYTEQIARDYVIASDVTAIRYDKDKVQTSPIGDRMVEIVARIDETADKLRAEIERLQELESDAIHLLINLKEEHERVLTLHYIEDKGLMEVAEIMGYSERYIFELRSKALTELDSLIQDMV